MTRRHPTPHAVATVVTVATQPRVATVASVATTSPKPVRLAGSVATVATRKIDVATANALMKQGSCHTFHSGHTRRTDIGKPHHFLTWNDWRRGRASILSLGSGKCGKCGHSPFKSKTYQWPHEIAMWPLWPLAVFGRSLPRICITDEAAVAVMVRRDQRRARGPPPFDCSNQRATTASSAKNQTVVALTTIITF
jgi:hypothetical protein